MKLLATLAAALTVGACSASPPPMRPVVVQGAMEVEVRNLAAAIENRREEKIGGWTFWIGTLDGYPVIVSKTQKGMENAAAATVLAAERYHPAAILNQGTAGGHRPDLHVFDIVVGTESVNLGSFKTGFRPRGRGSEFGEWQPLDLMRSDGSAGQDPNARKMRRFAADQGLLTAAHDARGAYRHGQVVDGVIGSSEVWNSEIDRIARFQSEFGTAAEEMETAAAAQIAAQFGVPFLGVRVLSNNITNDEGYDTKTAEACQLYAREVVKRYAERMRATDR